MGKSITISPGLLCVCVLLSDGFYRQVNQISGAHNKAESNAPTKTKKRRGSTRGMAPSVVSFFFIIIREVNRRAVRQEG